MFSGRSGITEVMYRRIGKNDSTMEMKNSADQFNLIRTVYFMIKSIFL